MSDLFELAHEDYFSPDLGSNWQLASLIGHDGILYFSHARHALAHGLQIIGIAPGDKILFPGFVCRDLLSSLHSVGAVPVFYPVERDLTPGALDSMPPAKAIVAINYFGFPQDLSPFQDYCLRTGATLVEDNAHGLFSRDSAGRWLGTRAEIGIFSLRKTVPLPDGAALVANNFNLRPKLGVQLPGSQLRVISAATIKRLLCSPKLHFPPSAIRLATLANRMLRTLRTGRPLPAPNPESEYTLPGNPAPHIGLLSALGETNLARESVRRRGLYDRLARLITNQGFELVFKTLPEGTVPYALPFYATDAQAARICQHLAGINVDCVRWPDLPEAIKYSAPVHYRTIWMINFLW